MVSTSGLPPSVKKAISKQKSKDVSTGRSTKVTVSKDKYGNYRVTSGTTKTAKQILEEQKKPEEDTIREISSKSQAIGVSAAYVFQKQAAARNQQVKYDPTFSTVVFAPKSAKIDVSEAQIALKQAQQRQAAKASVMQNLVKTELPPEIATEVRQELQEKAIQQTYYKEPQTEIAMPIKEKKPSLELEKEVQAGIREKLQTKSIDQSKSIFLEPTKKIEPKLRVPGVVEGYIELPKEVGKGLIAITKEAYRAGAETKTELKAGFTTGEILGFRKQQAKELIQKPEVQTTAILGGLALAPGIVQFAAGATFVGQKTEEFLRKPSGKIAGEIAFVGTVGALAKPIREISKGTKTFTENILFTKQSPGYKVPGTPFIDRPTYVTEYISKPIRTESGKLIGYEVVPKEGQQKFSEIFTAPKVKTLKNEFGIPIEVGRPKLEVQPTYKDLSLSEILPKKIIEVEYIKDIKGFKAELGDVSIVKTTKEPFKAERFAEIPRLKVTATKETKLTDFGFKKPLSEEITQSKIFRTIETQKTKSSKLPTLTKEVPTKDMSLVLETKKVEKPITNLKNTFKPSKGFYEMEYAPVYNTLFIKQKEKGITLTPFSTDIKTGSSLKTEAESSILLGSGLSISSSLKDRSLSDTSQSIDTSSMLGIMSALDVSSSSKIKQDTLQESRLRQEQITDTRLIPKITEIGKPKPPEIKIPKIPKPEGQKLKRGGLYAGNKVEGYMGKVKTNKGYVNAHKNPLPYADSFNKTARIVDTYANRSMRIVKSDKKVTPTGSRINNQLANKFRQSKKVKNTFVEKSKNAIDTYQEKKQITFKGISARRETRRKK